MRSNPITVTSQGQITIPKEMRDLMASQTVILELDPEQNNEIKIIPVSDVGGSLKAFSQGSEIDFKSEREQAWKEVESKFKKSV